MRCYRFRFSGSLQHEELWEDCDGFKPDGEGPEDLQRVNMSSNTEVRQKFSKHTSVNVYFIGNSMARMAEAPNRYSTLKVSLLGSTVGL